MQLSTEALGLIPRTEKQKTHQPKRVSGHQSPDPGYVLSGKLFT